MPPLKAAQVLPSSEACRSLLRLEDRPCWGAQPESSAPGIRRYPLPLRCLPRPATCSFAVMEGPREPVCSKLQTWSGSKKGAETREKPGGCPRLGSAGCSSSLPGLSHQCCRGEAAQAALAELLRLHTPPLPHLFGGTQISQQPCHDCTHQGRLEIKRFLKPEQKSPALWAALHHATTETGISSNKN